MKVKLKSKNNNGTWLEILKDGKPVTNSKGLNSEIYFDKFLGVYNCKIFINTKHYNSTIFIPAIEGEEKAMLKLVMPIIRKVLEMSD